MFFTYQVKVLKKKDKLVFATLFLLFPSRNTIENSSIMNFLMFKCNSLNNSSSKQSHKIKEEYKNFTDLEIIAIAKESLFPFLYQKSVISGLSLFEF